LQAHVQGVQRLAVVNPSGNVNMTMNQVVLLLSGGLDSSSLLFWALNKGWDVLPLFVDYGQITQPSEWQSVCALLDLAGLPPTTPIAVSEIACLGTGTLAESTADVTDYFPSRNLLLLTLAAMYSFVNDVSHIMIGLIADAAAALPDCSSQFVDRVRDVLNIEYPHLNVQAPFIERSKMEIVSEAMAYGLQPELTFSCNRLPDHHCWECSSCLDRLRVLEGLHLIPYTYGNSG
jgi:7-cyano-7-deazaguanine synthase